MRGLLFTIAMLGNALVAIEELEKIDPVAVKRAKATIPYRGPT